MQKPRAATHINAAWMMNLRWARSKWSKEGASAWALAPLSLVSMCTDTAKESSVLDAKHVKR